MSGQIPSGQSPSGQSAAGQVPAGEPTAGGTATGGTATGGTANARFDPALVGVPGPLDELSFEQILTALENVTNRMAGGDLGIEAATDLYEQAEILHAAAQQRLEAVEARISKLAPPSGG